ncbi:MAG: hypothetical protein BWY09_01131 [Candidatus Hydrogenedentes bacterium ADurb.Bin179]|nr:MAG: hypothetical protein BWY09_01131 [Candidatus Hydrogenedentes bacterium ADurb.Bin179]
MFRVVRLQGDDTEEGVHAFGYPGALADDFLGQAGLGAFEPVLHLDRGDVQIRADLEGQRDGEAAVIGALGLVIQQVRDAAHLLLDGRRHALHDRLGVRARIVGADHDGGRRDLGRRLDGQGIQGHQPADDNDNGYDPREHGAVNKKLGNHNCFLLRVRVQDFGGVES